MKLQYLFGCSLLVILLCSVLLPAASAQSETLTINGQSSYFGVSPQQVTFVATCTSDTCNGPTNIYDYGTAQCPAGDPDLHNACNYADISTMTTPCRIDHSGTTTVTDSDVSVSSSSAQLITDNICAYTQSDSGIQFQAGSLSIAPVGSNGVGGATSNGIVSAICNVYYIVNTIVFILALTLMILGGALYAGAQILPGSARGQVQGYAMGLIFGGVVGAIIAVLAPYILSIVYGNTVAGILTVCPA